MIICAAEVPEADYSYMLPWSLDLLYQVEPELKKVMQRAVSQKQRRYKAKRAAYVAAKDEAWELVGWYARDPRLRSMEAWDCFFSRILHELNI